MTSYYLDTCIWLNLFKKEGRKPVPYWKIAKRFIEKILFSEEKIIYSGLILKELKYQLNKRHFREKQAFFRNEEQIKFAKTTKEDYSFARKLEFQTLQELSFYDYLHIAICKRLDLVLITRDQKLLDTAKCVVKARKPEELL